MADQGRRGVLAIPGARVPSVRPREDDGRRALGRAAQGDQCVRREGDGGDGGHALQHRHRRDDGVCQRGDQVGRKAAENARAFRAAARAVRAASLRGAVGHARPRGLQRVRGVAGGGYVAARRGYRHARRAGEREDARED